MNILEPLGAVVLLSIQLLDAAVFSSEVWAGTFGVINMLYT